jgi:hypothetical protein
VTSAPDTATKTVWTINSASQGNKRIRRMKDWDVADGGSKESHGEVGSEEHVGTITKPGGRTITFNMRETKGATPEIDWQKLLDLGEWFSLTKQVGGGRRTQFPRCQVSKIDDNGDDQGVNEYSVEIVVVGKPKQM